MERNIKTLLEIDLDALSDNDADALAVLERMWANHGCPLESQALIHVLGKTLDYVKSHGIHYPRILLKRKGQLTRREFEPRIISATTLQRVKFIAPSHPKIPKEWIERAVEEEMNRLQSRKVN